MQWRGTLNPARTQKTGRHYRAPLYPYLIVSHHCKTRVRHVPPAATATEAAAEAEVVDRRNTKLHVT
ncbi:hypothetical protein HPB50_014361 [Hyalomma asiaticum]|uniref:Uncharacterized protein n=1 Tax=Hyalomma asiaticum TaxID=266040 RepID=A0ACB7RR18_HYAAI|nr:hypothetical protein HPB50_014361 [Hyalomma asiaticum]